MTYWDRLHAEVRQPEGYVMEYSIPGYVQRALEPIYAELDAREEEAHGDLFRFSKSRNQADTRSD